MEDKMCENSIFVTYSNNERIVTPEEMDKWSKNGSEAEAAMEAVVLDLVDEWSSSVCLDLHFLVKTQRLTTDALYGVAPLVIPMTEKRPSRGGSEEDYALTSSSLSESNAQCQICGEEVSGSRFAAHLNKCFNKAKKAGLL